ncbi:ribosome small subunit-dependent GTPase A [Guptibacillus algicola]|uniref:ribosome small subunit-dependent GTPase A n=1 Tax=Guptibacillus algicola TaxID=225844 RepID=UPI001CD30F30|nr:ribosome small subunit-dependent GTPase A [Alkalihalobacillus algicola]MCA0989048.1 ribosome small subunit-dependent GTPase A [Alkalihalobacillus algicola]
MNLINLGWNEFFDDMLSEPIVEGSDPARVIQEHRGSYVISNGEETYRADLAGKYRFEASTRDELPAVGDFVLATLLHEEKSAIIHKLVPRKSKFSRKAAGNTTDEQIIAANIDTVFLVNALNQDFNLGRIERYLVMAWESGANPVIVLSKADLSEDSEEMALSVEKIACGVPVHIVSSTTSEGLETLHEYLGLGRTVALLGSSGAGKSTLINKLYGSDIQRVQGIRDDDGKGRHTTTSRELVVLENGGVLIDTPGMRELQLWDAGESMTNSFQDIEDLSKNCFFRDCTHSEEPKCAVHAAIVDGTLDQRRFENYKKFERELAYLQRQTDKRAQIEERKKWKKIAGDRTRQHRR